MRFLNAILFLTASIAQAPQAVQAAGCPVGGEIDISQTTALPPPPPCQPLVIPPGEVETEKRFNKFANAFIVTKNITEAFTYISAGYINHNPLAKNGSESAWNILSPIWPSINITVLRTTFRGNMGWLNYNASGIGEVVDRFRWDAGCIVEHWDQGEKFPSFRV
ncbi:hypothetical protein FOYG_16166 [Fusarium oxysporum NRRL 32931]|uniref:SnoaL-like domain-containing protein n=1 Tax=Fusarium oxysporum NRRL 32931 TaxID=660029 RepID=W9HP48_FUSOX|nr:hypothetical protein FOYG_16166 [Fusarium oxysporum NRRL 32931]